MTTGRMTTGPSAIKEMKRKEKTRWKTARKALQYCWRKRSLGITYGGKPREGARQSAWVDADHGTRPDKRRRVSGGAVIMCDSAISWSSRVEKVTAVRHQSRNT